MNNLEFEVERGSFTYNIKAERQKYSNHSGSFWRIEIYSKNEYPHHGESKNYFLIDVNDVAEVKRFVKLVQKLLDYTTSPEYINESLTLKWLFKTLKSSGICLYGHEIRE